MASLSTVLKILGFALLCLISWKVQKKYPGLSIVFGIIAALVFSLSLFWSDFFPPRLDNEPLVSAIQYYAAGAIRHSDLGLEGDASDIRISKLILHKDSQEDKGGHAIASVLGSYTITPEEGSNTSDYKVKLQFGYLLDGNNYQVIYHKKAPRFIFEP